MRSSMLEVLTADYIRTARAKGVSEGIFWRHALRNASLPAITVLGPAIAAITTGGFVVELVFAIQVWVGPSWRRCSSLTTPSSWAPRCSTEAFSSSW